MNDRFDEIAKMPTSLLMGQFESVLSLETTPEFGSFIRNANIRKGLRFNAVASIVRAKALCYNADAALAYLKQICQLFSDPPNAALAEELDALRYEIFLCADDSKTRLEGWLYHINMVLHHESFMTVHDLAFWCSLVASQLLRGIHPGVEHQVNGLCSYMRGVCACLNKRLSADENGKSRVGGVLTMRELALLLSYSAFQVFLLMDPATAQMCDGMGPYQEVKRQCKEAIHLPMYLRPSLLHQVTMVCHRLGGSEVTLPVRAFLDAVREWRGQLGRYCLRSGLRRALAWQSNQVLECCRQQLTHDKQIGELLAEAEDTLGPARLLHERIVVGTGSSPDAMVGRPDWPGIFRGNRGRILQLAVAGDDLWFFLTEVESGDIARTLPPRRRENGAARLRKVYLDRVSKQLPQIQKSLKDVDRNGYEEQMKELHAWALDTSGAVGDVVQSDLTAMIGDSNEDVVIACYDPRLLALPWSLVEIEGRPLIERVRSLTFNMSVGATAALASRSMALGNVGEFGLAAYCHDGGPPNRLRWERMFFDKKGKSSGLLKLAEGDRFILRTSGIKRINDREADIASLEGYARDEECSVLLIAGHGHPRKGVHLAGDWYWKPTDLAFGEWRLSKTECAILPSCRLGEMRWDDPAKDGDADPSRSEIVGFAAGLCVSGIPRVIACPWVVYDLPICRLIPMIVRQAVDKRATGEPHYWARAVRDVVVDVLRTPIKGVGTYDLANLMLFGAP